MQAPQPNRSELAAQTPASIAFMLKPSFLDMAGVLNEVEDHLPELLQDRKNWRSMFIDYQPPHLMRIHHQLGLVRINLHYFLPVDQIDAKATDARDINLYHPHPWAAAFRILEGHYGQYFGVAPKPGTDNPPPRQESLIIQDAAISGKNRYVMANHLLWHQVIPFADGRHVSTLMVTHIPENWPQIIAPPAERQRELTAEELDFMFDHFAKFYPAPNSPINKEKPIVGTQAADLHR